MQMRGFLGAPHYAVEFLPGSPNVPVEIYYIKLSAGNHHIADMIIPVLVALGTVF